MTTRPGRLHDGSVVVFPGGREAIVMGHGRQTVLLRFEPALDEAYFIEYGHVPLPPYIRREDAPEDETRYQTVYAAEPGSVAAPTAGLHLTAGLMAEIEKRGIPIVPVTLHVGMGTFLPVRSDEIDEHVMHSEEYEIPAESAAAINGALDAGRPVVAVGTTSVRTLEGAWRGGRVAAERASTDLFIRPGYEFRVVSGMLTNFHTPESTLLMLVCAFAGRDEVLAAYAEAVRERYRFFSYGDATLIL
jgi:S-adenosylmethionine:tRNA ribosyltransferase-isomerase